VSLPLLGAGKGSPGAAAPFVSDSFTDTNGVLLTAHTGEVGATWTKQTGFADNLTIGTGNVLFGSGAANFAAHYASGVPPTADYTITGTVIYKSILAGSIAFLQARQSTTADTSYKVLLDNTTLTIQRAVAGTVVVLGSPYTFTGGEVPGVGQTRTFGIQVQGTAVKAFYDGAEKISVTDGNVTAAGRVLVRLRNSTATTGIVMDSVVAA
jgi:hypothetical protein